MSVEMERYDEAHGRIVRAIEFALKAGVDAEGIVGRVVLSLSTADRLLMSPGKATEALKMARDLSKMLDEIRTE